MAIHTQFLNLTSEICRGLRTAVRKKDPIDSEKDYSKKMENWSNLKKELLDEFRVKFGEVGPVTFERHCLKFLQDLDTHYNAIKKIEQPMSVFSDKSAMRCERQATMMTLYLRGLKINLNHEWKKWINEFPVTLPNSNDVKKSRKPPIKEVDPMTLLTTYGKRNLGEYEAILKDKIPEWEKKKHGALAECAAFCDYLHFNNMIRKLDERVMICSQFAWNKYGIDIRIQLEKIEKEREKNILKIERILKQG
jgi:hypothetical protein